MAFTLSGSTITQTGTDTSLAGLSGIAGVTTTTRIGGFTTYDLGARSLRISGALNIGGAVAPLESLIVGQDADTTPPDIDVISGGFLTLGGGIVSQGISDSAQSNTLIYEPGLNKGLGESSGLSENAFIRVRSGGKFVWLSGTINTWGGFGFDLGSDVTVGASGWSQKPVLDVSRMRRPSIPTAGTGLIYDFSNIKMYGLRIFGGRKDGVTPGFGGWGLLSLPVVFKGYEPLYCNIGIAGSSSLTAGTYVIEDYAGVYASGFDIEKRAGGSVIYKIRNGLRGTALTLFNNPSTGTVVVDIEQDLSITGTAGGVVSLKGSDGVFRSALANGSGVSTILQVLVGKSPNGTAVISQYFGANDIATVSQLAYDREYATAEVLLRGPSIKGVTILSLPDTNVTLSETNAVAKFASSFTVSTSTNTITVTANSTLDDLYDVMKAYKTRNVQAQLEYPTISTQPVVASGDTLVTAMNIVGIEFLTTGTKFKKLQANATANGTISNLSIIGNVNQATPTNLSNVTISGTLTYNTNTATSIAISNGTSIGTVANSGTGIVTISRDNTSNITTYTDAEINFLDSNITFAGVNSITFYPTSGDANAGTNAGETITTSPYNFKYGSVISGVTMSGTLNIRYIIGGKVTIGTLIIALGVNSFVLTDNELLSAISAKVDITNNNLPKVNRNVIKGSKLIPAGETF